MIEASRFEWLMADLEQVFNPMAESKIKRDAILEKYYNRLKYNNEDTLKKAAAFLLDTHPYKRFPLIQEIRNAVDQVSKERSYATPEDLRGGFPCPFCNDTGAVLEPYVHFGREYVKASACTCKEGEKFEKRWREYLVKR